MNDIKRPEYNNQKVKVSKFSVFMDILKIRFWNIAKLNLICMGIYSVFIIVYAVYLSNIFLPFDLSDFKEGYTNFGELLSLVVVRIPYVLVLFTIPVVAFGPAVSGMAVVFRSYVRRDDSFSSDFTDGLKKFFWKSLAISVISTVILVCLGIAFRWYLINLDPGFMKVFLLMVIGLFAVFFLMMHLYVYQILVEYDLSIWKCYKNAYTFAILRFIPNLLIIAGIAAITILPFFIHVLVGAVLMFVLLFGISAYVINFFAWPALEKHLDPIMKEAKIPKVRLY
jgi:uncharacterized membrane protein YesL